MVDKGIRRRTRHAIRRYAKANINYMKYHDKNVSCTSFAMIK